MYPLSMYGRHVISWKIYRWAFILEEKQVHGISLKATK